MRLDTRCWSDETFQSFDSPRAAGTGESGPVAHEGCGDRSNGCCVKVVVIGGIGGGVVVFPAMMVSSESESVSWGTWTLWAATVMLVAVVVRFLSAKARRRTVAALRAPDNLIERQPTPMNTTETAAAHL